MVDIRLPLALFRHRNHLHRLLVLSLTPLRHGCTTVPLPEHHSELFDGCILISREALIARELSNVLEASLPQSFLDHALDAVSKVELALRVCSPAKEEAPESALEVVVLVGLSH